MYQQLIQLSYQDNIKLFSKNDGLTISGQMLHDYIKTVVKGKDYEDEFWFDYNMGVVSKNDFIELLRFVKKTAIHRPQLTP